MVKVSGYYVSSRALMERAVMWQALRAQGLEITSTWIDKMETFELANMWASIVPEIAKSKGVILYAEDADFPIKGALIECGMALGMGKPVAVILHPDINIEGQTFRPIGSWIKHPNCARCTNIFDAVRYIDLFGAQPENDNRAPLIVNRGFFSAIESLRGYEFTKGKLDVCPHDGKSCYETRGEYFSEQHFRCGTVQCGAHRKSLQP